MSVYQGSHQQYDVVCEPDVGVPMRDGVRLSADIYFPAVGGRRAGGRFPIVLERTPYDNSSPTAVTNAKYFARRGYVCVIQDVRGRFESEGEWYAFAKEAPDGYDTIEWLAAQDWSDGKVGTMGSSYAGSDQSAAATLNPPHLSTMIVGVGASNYFHGSMRQNGAVEQRFQIYAFRMAMTSKEAAADPALKAAIRDAFENRMPQMVDNFPLKKGATPLSGLPSYEQWATDIARHSDYDDYWKQRGYAISEYYEEHADVPTLYLGGWYDSYARNTCESFMKLSRMKRTPQRLLMGPWTHGGWEVTYSGDVDFGVESHLHHNDMRLAWFDHYLKGMNTEVAGWPPVRIFTMGSGRVHRDDNGRIFSGGFWRDEGDWPPPDVKPTSYFLHAGGEISTEPPAGPDSPSTFTYDPKDPVPTMGGGISAADNIMVPGAFDQRGRPDFHGCSDTEPLNTRPDVLSFQTGPLDTPVEITGPVEVRLWASTSAVDTDFTAKLLDVVPPSSDYPDGLAINITDSIIRGRYRDGWDRGVPMEPGRPYEIVFQLYPTSTIFREGHRIRLDISSSNWPRFDVNPNTGGPLGIHGSYERAAQSVYHDRDRASCVVLSARET